MRYLLVPNGEVIVELATYLGEAATVTLSPDLYIRGESGETAELYVKSLGELTGIKPGYQRNNSSHSRR